MRKYPAVMAAVLATTPIIAVAAQPAEAAQPAAAKTWSSLMWKALSPMDEVVRLRAALPSLRQTATVRKVAVQQTTAAQSKALAGLTAATATNVKAKKAYATAVAIRKKAKTKAERRRLNATVVQRRTQLGKSVVTLRTAETGLRNATVKLVAANDAWQAAAAAVRNAELKTATDGYNARPAGQAAELAAQVVTDTRAAFKTTDTTQVHGITVNRTVAYAFKHMIDDAAKDGVALSGGGFRTRDQQIKLRVTNGCPDIWTAPASSCKVPTAIPGRSLHEIGLAVDMTYGGKTIPNHASPGYKWLAAHAARYGYQNLPSEPWHWSITGG
ncbi:M15 family metallopeptidase [Actinoplanes sp. KI2]|uniref:M15 family metallopeptidase n=1 Tax=Actinoplanes sp. KI2 TaxID=2983315 RepID=UPI0021D5A499|nr:M15 family metallopeptidase [Actinoplanes sp. KI2]MCU7726449.1 M15 family metallopeptidase [Actinoplanes sp. KI2]